MVIVSTPVSLLFFHTKVDGAAKTKRFENIKKKIYFHLDLRSTSILKENSQSLFVFNQVNFIYGCFLFFFFKYSSCGEWRYSPWRTLHIPLPLPGDRVHRVYH